MVDNINPKLNCCKCKNQFSYFHQGALQTKNELIIFVTVWGFLPEVSQLFIQTEAQYKS